MSQRSDLVVAEFLDSAAARALGRRDDVRRAAKLVVDACFDDLGIEPRLLDREQTRDLLLNVVARKIGAKDPLVPLVPRVARALFGHLADTALVPNSFEIDAALDEIDAGFAAAVRADGERAAGKAETIVNRADKVGRNDPCPCGSGKKFKQCCLKLG